MRRALVGEKIMAIKKFTVKNRTGIFFVFLFFCILLMVLVSFFAVKNYGDSQEILQSSVNDRMIGIACAARENIDIEKFMSYNSLDDIMADDDYMDELNSLKNLASDVGAKYIYALKEIDGEYYFIYDTDPEVIDKEGIYEAYEIEEVHERAFQGEIAAQASGTDDIYGSFSTAAVPLYYGGKLVGIISADIDDEHILDNENVQFWNMAVLIAIIGVMFVIMAVLLLIMLKRISTMQDLLYRQSRYDKLTSLPNRQYLLEYLEDISSREEKYSLFFIDLDNFKQVNDTAGHDAGDELLRHIGEYISSAHKNSKAFRPASGSLNVAARIGGDEFILVAPNLSEQESLVFAQELVANLKNEVKNSNIEKFGVGLSVGVALFPEHSENFHVLLKYADIAMYHAKHAGKNMCFVYSMEMKAKDEK